uniref:Uncharacterized protein n=1 Tax=Opuntia streptacantha TaxID=393608 RepID=A0A7C8YV14_OPUST
MLNSQNVSILAGTLIMSCRVRVFSAFWVVLYYLTLPAIASIVQGNWCKSACSLGIMIYNLCKFVVLMHLIVSMSCHSCHFVVQHFATSILVVRSSSPMVVLCNPSGDSCVPGLQGSGGAASAIGSSCVGYDF